MRFEIERTYTLSGLDHKAMEALNLACDNLIDDIRSENFRENVVDIHKLEEVNELIVRAIESKCTDDN